MRNLVNKFKSLVNYKWFDYYLVAICAVLVGTFRLAYQSLWLDESISIVWAAKKPLLWIWENVPKSDLHPPLYYSVLHFWQLIFGDSVFSIRGLSVLFFIGSSVLVYFLTNKFFNSRMVSIFSSLIFITNPFAVLYAQEVRSYSMLIFFLLLNSWFFYSIIYLNNSSKKYYLAYFLTALILVYANILALFAMATHFIILLFNKDKEKLKRFFVGYVILAILYIPALKILKNANDFDYSYYNAERYGIILKTVVAFAGYIGARINILNGKNHIYGLLFVSIGLYAGLFLLLLRKIKIVNKFLLSFFIISFSLIMIAAHIKFPVPDPKYFYVSFPFFILLIANLIAVVDKKWKIAIFILIMLINSVFLYNYFFVKKYEKENWKSAVAMVEEDYLKEKNKNGLSISPFIYLYAPWLYYSSHSMPEVGFLIYGNSTSSLEKVYNEYGGEKNKIIYLSRFLSSMYDSNDNVYNFLLSKGYVKTKEFKDTKVEFWRLDIK